MTKKWPQAAASASHIHRRVPTSQQSQTPAPERLLTHQFIFVDWLNAV